MLSYLNDLSEQADSNLRSAGGERLKPLLAQDYFTRWSRQFAVIKDPEIVGVTDTGGGKFNVRANIYQPATGAKREITFAVVRSSAGCGIREIREKCTKCNGTGRMVCPSCGGTGTHAVQVEDRNAYGMVVGTHYENRPCLECNGAGKVTCDACNGRGFNYLNPDLTAQPAPGTSNDD